VSCAVLDGDVFAIFTATPETFPTSFPSTATCTSQGYTLELNLRPKPWPAKHDPSMDPQLGITLDLQTDGPYAMHTYRVYDLPVGPSYAEGRWPARLSPSVPWDGAECGMAYTPDGAPRMWVRALISAAADEGYCVLQSESGVPHAIPLEILR
jgi:hypothetical protein